MVPGVELALKGEGSTLATIPVEFFPRQPEPFDYEILLVERIVLPLRCEQTDYRSPRLIGSFTPGSLVRGFLFQGGNLWQVTNCRNQSRPYPRTGASGANTRSSPSYTFFTHTLALCRSIKDRWGAPASLKFIALQKLRFSLSIL